MKSNIILFVLLSWNVNCFALDPIIKHAWEDSLKCFKNGNFNKCSEILISILKHCPDSHESSEMIKIAGSSILHEMQLVGIRNNIETIYFFVKHIKRLSVIDDELLEISIQEVLLIRNEIKSKGPLSNWFVEYIRNLQAMPVSNAWLKLIADHRRFLAEGRYLYFSLTNALISSINHIRMTGEFRGYSIHYIKLINSTIKFVEFVDKIAGPTIVCISALKMNFKSFECDITVVRSMVMLLFRIQLGLQVYFELIDLLAMNIKLM